MKRRKTDSDILFPGRSKANKHMMFIYLKNSQFNSALGLVNKKSYVKHDYAAITTNVVQEQCNLG